MPDAAPKLCISCCRKTTKTRYCDDCDFSKNGKQQQTVATQTRHSKVADTRYKSRAWINFRVRILIANPFCAYRLKDGRICNANASHVDHIVALAKGGEMFDADNCQALCRRCHSVKTCREDGGFGNPKSISNRTFKPSNI